jgi:unsaturated rhamnogalacturonyl hydrolase
MSIQADPFGRTASPIRLFTLLALAGAACSPAVAAEGGTSRQGFKWSTAAADTFLRRFPDPDSIHWVNSTNHFSWQAGYAMFTFEKLWRLTGDVRYYDYIRRYVDQQVDGQGNVPGFSPDALDNFLPGYAILFMYEQTGSVKYRIAATRIRDGFRMGEAPALGRRGVHG